MFLTPMPPSPTQGASGDERAMAKELVELLCDGNADTVAEGQEPPEFWGLLGGKAPYANDKRYVNTSALYPGSSVL